MPVLSRSALLLLPQAFARQEAPPMIIDQCASACAQDAECEGWHHDGFGCVLEDRRGFALPKPFPEAEAPCTGDSKQKALYLSYDIKPSLSESPALDISADVIWNSTSDMRRYGANGIYAAHPISTQDGPGGYFGSQSDGDASQGGLLFSIWDQARRPADVNQTYCDLAPNATWCSRRHAFPLSENCHRHCNDCGLHPGWHNTTGTQCAIPLSISEGDSFRFRLFRSANATTLQDPEGLPFTYLGSEWTLTATKLGGETESEPMLVGKMFFEDTFEGISRFSAFHEHIGCTPCDAFYESEVRRGPWVDAPVARSVTSIGFDRPSVMCELFDVDIAPSGGVAAAQFMTGPGTGPDALELQVAVV